MRVRQSVVLRAIPVSLVVLGAAAVAAFNFQSADAIHIRKSPATFSIVVTTTPNGIVATCEQGCPWKRVSADYPQGTYRITEEGIAPIAADQ